MRFGAFYLLFKIFDGTSHRLQLLNKVLLGVLSLDGVIVSDLSILAALAALAEPGYNWLLLLLPIGMVYVLLRT